jgi:hypothetical protein
VQWKRWGLTLVLAGAACASAAAARDAAWVEQRVRDWQPTPRERRWEGIGWAKEIREAERLGKASGRPVFLFTLDGRMGVGRC